MQRDWAGLKHSAFDVLVVGGGIYGAWTAYDAALKGYRVALVEKTDWAAGTSSASSKLIHGGLRYLEQFNFRLVHHALAERATLNRIAPHAVDPVRFVIPSYTYDRVPRWKLRAGLTLYDFLAGRGQAATRHRKFTAEQLTESFPYLVADDLRGGFSYGDCQEDDARVTLEVVAAAQAAGAVVCNHAKMTKLLRYGDAPDGKVLGGRAECRLSGETIDIRARLTVLAAGPWAPKLAGMRSDVSRSKSGVYKLVKGVHLIMPKLPGPREAFLLTARSDGRVFFVIPWYEHTIIGTTESAFTEDPGAVRVTEEEARYLLSEANAALKPANWTVDDMCGCFAGVRTLMADGSDSLSAVSRDFHVKRPSAGLWMPVGGKYTTARGDAEGMVERMQSVLGPFRNSQKTSQKPLPWAPAGVVDEASERLWLDHARAQAEALGCDAHTAFWMAKRHGNRIEDLLAMIEADPSLAERVHPDMPFALAEFDYAAHAEMAERLDDVIRRRMPLTLLTQPDHRLVKTLSERLAPMKGWSMLQCTSEQNHALERWPAIRGNSFRISQP